MSFINLFGGDKKVNNTKTENTSIDASTTKSNSDNVSSWLQQNLAQIKNSTAINNTSLENTDSFNRTSLSLFSDVGNIAPGSGTQGLESASMERIFDSVLRSPVLNANTISKDPNANSKNFDFTGTSKIATDVITASGKNQLGTFFEGVTDLSKATSPTSASNSPWLYPLIGVVVIVVAFLFFRRR
jgi:hypothetical protein